MTSIPDKLRPHAEEVYAGELRAIKELDDRPRPPRWQLSPRAVVDYLCGGQYGDTIILPKYVGSRRLMESAVATLATDRALLLLGAPGTAKSWVSEHLAAAVSGDSTRIVQGTAGTGEDAIRYGWNYAELIAHGPSRAALVASPVMRAMETGALVRLEELTRIPSEVQDALLTILSEKALPVPEIDQEVEAVQGFNVVATANDRDKGVNELSGALKRRFNTVVLPLPASEDEEVQIVVTRAASISGRLEIPARPDLEEVRRVVRTFRELRSGQSHDGRTSLKTPSSTLSTADAIGVVVQGLTMSAHFGNGQLRTEDLSEAVAGAVLQDPKRDAGPWREYLETVARTQWPALYEATRSS